MKEYYLVDGYNVINNWPEFAGIRDKDLEHARDLLTDQVAEFSFVAMKRSLCLTLWM